VGGEIIGWARDLDDPSTLAEIRIVADSRHVIKWKPTHYRSDVCHNCGEEGIFGFHVPIPFLLNFGTKFSFYTADDCLLDEGHVEIPLESAFEVGPVSIPECNIYLHIQKTMGTSVVNLIHHLLEKSRFLSIYPQFGLTIPQFVGLPLIQKRTLSLILGHTSFGIDKYLGNHARYIAVVREPISRVRSNLFHILGNTGPRYSISGVEYALDKVVNNGLTAEFDNLQVRMIAGLDDSVLPLDKIKFDDAHIAIHHLENRFKYVGAFENFNETAKDLLRSLGLGERELPHLNEAKPDIMQKYQDVIERIDWDRIRMRHLPEIVLYEHVVKNESIAMTTTT